MVVESLLYLQNSYLNTNSVILQPEITHNPTFFDADLIDPSLTIECFYRLFRIVKIRTGRKALSETLARRRRYDPIITVKDGEVQFETFSNDMTHYACLILDESAFKNIQQWELGQTNVDFTPEFINNLRKAGSSKVRSLAVDPEGFYVDTNEESYYEKKVDLPENWKIGLENIRTTRNSEEMLRTINQPKQFLSKTPFGPFCNQKFASIEKGWVPKEGWQFASLNLRNNLGKVIVGTTSQIFERFDGRQNPKYTVVRSNRMLRKLKSYLLETKKISENKWKVKGSSSGKVRNITKYGSTYRCDCEDFKFRGRGRPGFQCKHIRAVLKPKLDIHLSVEDKWDVYEIHNHGMSIQKNIVEFHNQKITCSCLEYSKINICNHIIGVLKEVQDFQFDELKQDLC